MRHLCCEQISGRARAGAVAPLSPALAATSGAPGKVTGRVTNAASGAAVAGATVTVGSLSIQTDSYGNYTFSSMPPGSHTLQISAAGYQPYQSPVMIGPDTLLLASASLQPLPGTLTVQVVDAATGKPIKGAIVSVGTLGGRTNTSGDFSGSMPGRRLHADRACAEGRGGHATGDSDGGAVHGRDGEAVTLACAGVLA